MNRPEEALHRSVVAWLAVRLPKSWMFWHTPNGGGRSAAEAGILKALGTRAGMPDLFVLGPGSKLVAIELKAPPVRLKGGGLSKARPSVSNAQAAILGDLARLGVPTIVARSIDEVERGLIGVGVIAEQGRGR